MSVAEVERWLAPILGYDSEELSVAESQQNETVAESGLQFAVISLKSYRGDAAVQEL